MNANSGWTLTIDIQGIKMKPVLQEWVQRLTFMQQSVLISAVRGPDGIEKDHVSKLLIRWLRRCILYSAFESRTWGRPVSFDNPVQLGGGSFTGPSVPFAEDTEGAWQYVMTRRVLKGYLETLDAVPHHFQLHFQHAAEILGYKHPSESIRAWWLDTYRRLANDLHLNPETEEQMDRRLGDFEETWREAEEIIARGPA